MLRDILIEIQMEKQIDLRQVTTEKGMKDTVSKFLEILQQHAQTDSSKITNQFFDMIHKNIMSASSPPKSKFMSIMILKTLGEQGQKKCMSQLNSHALLKEMASIAQKNDPQKPISEKGKKMFPGDIQAGKDYLRLILECLHYWAYKIGKSKSGVASKFSKYYNDLVSKKVVFPNYSGQFKFIDPSLSTSVPKREDYEHSTDMERGGHKAQNPKGKASMRSQLSFTKDKIASVIATLQDFQGRGQNLERVTQESHTTINNQMKKNQRFSDNLGGENSETVQLYLQIMSFLNQQKELYNHHVLTGKNCHTYRIAICQLHQTTFESMNSPRAPSGSSEPKFNSGQGEEKKNQQVLSKLLSKFKENQQRPPKIAFGTVKEELKEQKSRSKSKLSQTKRRSVSPVDKTKLLRSSAVQSSISPLFSNPPNSSPRPKKYQGVLNAQNPQLNRIIRQLNKNQGIRRFKAANFKKKNPLVEGDHLQIGYKTEIVFQKIPEFENFVSLELYIGNKTDSDITNLALSFKGSENIVAYSSPQQVGSFLSAGSQNKLELIIAIVGVPFSILQVKISYEYRRIRQEFGFYLPNSMMKLANYAEITQMELQSEWGQSKIFKTEEFRLCKFTSIQTIQKYIDSLAPLTSYNLFVAPGSQTDFELFCKVYLAQKHQALLKICVRPNLQVVIQMAIRYESGEAIEFLLFYLQTLQMLLKCHSE